MKTTHYNPSTIELDFVNTFSDLSTDIESNLGNLKIISKKLIRETDNPMIVYKLEDQDGDLHEVVVQVIQRPDVLVSPPKKKDLSKAHV